jgi:hypothetical protein
MKGKCIGLISHRMHDSMEAIREMDAKPGSRKCLEILCECQSALLVCPVSGRLTEQLASEIRLYPAVIDSRLVAFFSCRGLSLHHLQLHAETLRRPFANVPSISLLFESSRENGIGP